MTHNRILVFSTDDHLFPAGGAEQAFGHIAARMPEVTFDLICARLRRGVSRYEERGNVRIHRIGFGIPRVDGFLLALFGSSVARRLIREYRYDLIWSIMASYGAFAAVRIKKQTGLPFLLTLQEGDSLEHIYRRVRWVRSSFEEIFRQADAVQAISHFLLGWSRDMGYRGSHGVVIPNGVDLALFMQEVPPATRAARRASFGFPEDACVIVTSSRLEKKNGIGDLIASLSLVPEKVCLVICGGGSLDAVLRAQVETLGLSARVRFLGFVEPVALPEIFAASHIFARPSLSEGLGNAFLEAMAAGLPVIGTPVGGIPDFLIDGETGYMAKPENPESIAHAVTTIMESPASHRARICATAREMVRERYDWGTIAASMRACMEAISKQS
jgi:glycosyltransferase involved in cell wall biosynthesis